MNLRKWRILMNLIFNSQFNYCPLFWMFHIRSVNSKINHLHERISRIEYSDFKSSFGTVSIYAKSLEVLATEMFKISKNFYVPLMSELFRQKVNHFLFQIQIALFKDKGVYRTLVYSYGC